jgi:uncharacterized protein YeaO (DUF488 family)
MGIRVVRLGTPKAPGEGVRLGTVRRPPRGVPKDQYAKQHYYDVWLPNLAPSAALVHSARTLDSAQGWKRFAQRYRAEMKKPDASRLLDALAALSHTADFSVGCYCEDEQRCHRSVLREILREHGATIASGESGAGGGGGRRRQRD